MHVPYIYYSHLSTKSALQKSTVGVKNLDEKYFPFGIPSGGGMVFYVDKITDLKLVRRSCRCMIFDGSLSIEADIFPCKGKDITALRSRRPFIF